MPDPVALGIQVPDSFRTIGSMLNFAQNAQNIQRSALALEREKRTFDTDVAQRKAESSSAETAADLARQTLGPRVAQQAAHTKSAQTASNLAQWQLDSTQAGKAYEIAAGLSQDPAIKSGDSAGIVRALMQAQDVMRSHKIPDDKIAVQTAPLFLEAVRNPSGVRQMLDNIVRAQSGASAQAQVANAPVQYANTGAALVPVQTQPGATPQPGVIQPGGAPVAKPAEIPTQLPLGERQNVQPNAVTGTPQTIEKDAQGRVISVTPTPTGAGIPTLAPGDKESLPGLVNLRSSINSAAQGAGESKFNNEQIIRLANDTNLGTGSQLISNLRGQYAALPWTGDSATNFNTLGHFIARESANMASKMGANTDASRGLAEQANVSTGWTADAVKSAAKVNNALVVGLENFNKGMEKAVATAGGDVRAVRAFQNAWSQSFDPNVYRYANALATGDKSEITKILGPEGSTARKQKALDLANKSATLNRLSTMGQ